MDYKGVATSLFGSLADKYRESFLMLKNSLLSANIKTPLRTYMSVTFLATVLAYFGTMGAVAVLTSLSILKISGIMIFVYFVSAPIFVACLTFLTMVVYPSQVAISRNRNIETNLPFVLTHMGAVAESGVPPYIIFKLIGQFEDYGDIALEMRKIVRNVDEFGVDPITAVKAAKSI